MKESKVLVVTLYSGENEYDDCVESVDQQVGVEIEHEVIQGLPKQLAHQKLFEIFNRERANFDYFAKLDADMKFSSPDALIRLLDTMEDDVDLLAVSVWDEMTSHYMQSFNIFSDRCTFVPEENDPLFTDQVPVKFPGRRVYSIDPNRLVHHAFNPSPYQAFTFGVHRAMKIMQHGKRSPSLGNAYHQLKILRRVAQNFVMRGADSARVACVGAGLVMSGHITDSAFVARDDYRDVFASADLRNPAPLMLAACSGPPLIGVLKLWGVQRFIRGVVRYVKSRRFLNAAEN